MLVSEAEILVKILLVMPVTNATIGWISEKGENLSEIINASEATQSPHGSSDSQGQNM